MCTYRSKKNINLCQFTLVAIYKMRYFYSEVYIYIYMYIAKLDTNLKLYHS